MNRGCMLAGIVWMGLLGAVPLQGLAAEQSVDTNMATRAELQKSISELEKKKDAAKHKLDELGSATDSKWNDMKAGMTSALDELHHSYRKALSYLR